MGGMTKKRILMTEMTTVGEDYQDQSERAIKVKQIIEQTLKENQELLDRLGSDYDSNGVPYWEKYEDKFGVTKGSKDARTER